MGGEEKMTMMEPRDKELTDYLRCVFLKPIVIYLL